MSAEDPANARDLAAGPVVAVLGLGEAGSLIAADLVAAGAAVRGFDPRVAAASADAGIIECDGDADACRGATLVLSLTCAHEAENALAAALPGIGRAAIYADLNAGSSALKARLTDLGSVPLPGPPARFGKLIADETEKWGKVIRFAGIKS